jgi:CRP-like cAMP-binding protein
MTDDELRQNAIFAKLPGREFDRVRREVEVIDAGLRLQVYQPGVPIKAVYFPLTSVFSVVAVADGRVVVEVATTGREGMVGLPLFLGSPTSPHAAFCQIAGRAARLGADTLRKLLTVDGTLHRALNRFTQATMVQIAQNVVCNSTHSATQRACRWLLTTHDRMGRDQFDLTQEFLAQMLGVRRPTVSEIAGRLQSDGLIRYSRGVVTVVNRRGLEKASCNCYSIVKAEFDAMSKPA